MLVKIRGFSTQLGLGLWLGFAIFSAISTRNLSHGVGIALVGVFFASPCFCAAMMKMRNVWVRRTGLVGLVVALGAILFGVLLTAERVYTVNADSYPEFLATRLKGDASDATVLNALNCRPMEVMEKTNGFLIRCGLLRIDGPTFLTSRHPFSQSSN